MKINQKELEEIYKEVAERVDGQADYYTTVCAPVDTEYRDNCITFKALYSGGRDCTIEWEEIWYINSDGSIGNSEGEHWDNIEEFKSYY